VGLTYYERGELAGMRKAALRQLEAKFGPLSPRAKERVEAMSRQQLEDLLLALLTDKTLTDLGLED
jgi:hypothetical protein